VLIQNPNTAGHRTHESRESIIKKSQLNKKRDNWAQTCHVLKSDTTARNNLDLPKQVELADYHWMIARVWAQKMVGCRKWGFFVKPIT